MAKTAQQIYDSIKDYMGKVGRPYYLWYAGIAADAQSRLFDEHRVSMTTGNWVYDKCANNQDARTVEEWLLKLGCDGGIGGGDQTSTQVYAYLKTSNTKP